jgi:mannose-6-phosphate isomerase-like protein (cupin superfamily)
MLEKITLAEKLRTFDEPWSPRIIAELNGQHLKLARLEGAFVWHAHPDEDEAFLCLEGSLRIELRDGAVALAPGELVVVPRGVEHRPVADAGASVLLFEPASTVNTGDAGGPRTVERPERI